MTHSAALFDDNSQRILDDIDRQFHPTVPTLVDLTNKFLLEFKLGLDDYGQPMAMMFVSFNHFSSPY
jgi:hexokinase